MANIMDRDDLATLGTRGRFKYPIRHLIVISRGVSKPGDWWFQLSLVLKFDRRLDSQAVVTPVKLQSYLTFTNTNPADSTFFSLHWRHNDHDGVSNHQPHGCLFNRLFRRRSKKTSKLRVTGLCAGNSPGPVNSPHKGPVTRKMFPFDDLIMLR